MPQGRLTQVSMLPEALWESYSAPLWQVSFRNPPHFQVELEGVPFLKRSVVFRWQRQCPLFGILRMHCAHHADPWSPSSEVAFRLYLSAHGYPYIPTSHQRKKDRLGHCGGELRWCFGPLSHQNSSSLGPWGNGLQRGKSEICSTRHANLVRIYLFIWDFTGWFLCPWVPKTRHGRRNTVIFSLWVVIF